MKNTPTPPQARLLKRIFGICSLLAFTLPVSVMAQQTVFSDNFSGSTLSGISIPGGTFTASSTSYDIASGKSITFSSVGMQIVPGHFSLGMVSTSAGYVEAQAVFSKYPITLALPGDSIDVQYVITDTTNILNGKAGASTSLAVGLFNSGGSVPYTNLYAGGLANTVTTYTTGGVQNWLGYRGNLAYGGIGSGAGASVNSITYSRPAQTQTADENQTLIQEGSGSGFVGVNLGQNANTIAPLTVGSQYTVDFNITLGSDGNLHMTNTLYAGVGTGGTVLATNNAAASGANILTTNFDSLVIGGERTGSVITTNDINQLTITFTSSAQAGPYFVVTSGGGCGEQTVSLSGSVATNVYWLYLNGVNTGSFQNGTGSAISFTPAVSAAGTYTVEANNTVTTVMGPMFGSVIIAAGAPVFDSQPLSVVCATNSMAVFSAPASGYLLGYQWYAHGTALVNGGDMAGATTTNLVIYPVQAADAADGTLASGYYLVMTNPCGYSITSSPAALIIGTPNNLVWQGGDAINPNTWDLATTLNFTNAAGALEAFTNGDKVAFNDSAANTSVAITGNTYAPIAPTLVNVTGSQSYIFGGTGSIVGNAAVLVNGSATLTITNINNYKGGTVVSNSAILNIGDGTTLGKAPGAITVNSGATVHFFPNETSDVTLSGYGLNGVGNVIYEINENGSSTSGRTITLDTSESNAAFGGTIEIKPGTRLQVTTAYGLGGTNILVDDNYPLSGELYVNGTSITNTAAISIMGHGPASPVDTPYGQGAMRLNSTWAGPITIAGEDGSFNTAIGAATGTGRILGNITDNGNGYELEYYSGIIQVGPTTGVNTYGVTRITEGLSGSTPTSLSTTVVALNSNAFSTNTLNMNAQAILELNGNNLTFNNLIDESETAYNVSNLVPVILNGSTNASATITVGGDNGSQSFYGRFGNGGSQWLGLTKVGSGTLTLSGDSTNTGPVTVAAGTLALAQATVTFYNGSSVYESGSFSNTTAFAVYNSGTLDVSGRADQTLFLNSGQTLEGSGASIGTINVTGNVNIGNGTLLLSLNWTNTPSTSDSLAASGAITYGGTLAVTNIGPALKALDSFQLFSGATAGFTAFSLQTIDTVNKVKYTWNNTVTSNGKITVASVSPLVNTNTFVITNVVASGTNIVLSWPADRTGWYLQSQTNNLNTGLGTNWVTVPSSATTDQVTIPIVSTNGSVFFRMVLTNSP